MIFSDVGWGKLQTTSTADLARIWKGLSLLHLAGGGSLSWFLGGFAFVLLFLQNSIFFDDLEGQKNVIEYRVVIYSITKYVIENRA